MVYMEPSTMGFQPLLTSWLQTLPSFLDGQKEGLQTLFDHLVPTMEGVVFFVRKQVSWFYKFILKVWIEHM